VATGRLLVGFIRINARDTRGGFVPVAGVPVDVYIDGLAARNRALEGDIVVVSPLPVATWRPRQLPGGRTAGAPLRVAARTAESTSPAAAVTPASAAAAMGSNTAEVGVDDDEDEDEDEEGEGEGEDGGEGESDSSSEESEDDVAVEDGPTPALPPAGVDERHVANVAEEVSPLSHDTPVGASSGGAGGGARGADTAEDNLAARITALTLAPDTDGAAQHRALSGGAALDMTRGLWAPHFSLWRSATGVPVAAAVAASDGASYVKPAAGGAGGGGGGGAGGTPVAAAPPSLELLGHRVPAAFRTAMQTPAYAALVARVAADTRGGTIQPRAFVVAIAEKVNARGAVGVLRPLSMKVPHPDPIPATDDAVFFVRPLRNIHCNTRTPHPPPPPTPHQLCRCQWTPRCRACASRAPACPTRRILARRAIWRQRHRLRCRRRALTTCRLRRPCWSAWPRTARRPARHRGASRTRSWRRGATCVPSAS